MMFLSLGRSENCLVGFMVARLTQANRKLPNRSETSKNGQESRIQLKEVSPQE